MHQLNTRLGHEKKTVHSPEPEIAQLAIIRRIPHPLLLLWMILLIGCATNTEPSKDINGRDASVDMSVDLSLPDSAVSIASDLAPDMTPDMTPDLPLKDWGPIADGVTTLAGSMTSGIRDDIRTDAEFNNPVNVIVGPSGDLFVADFDNGLVRKVTPEGLVTTILSGPAEFDRPFGLVFANDGSLYVQTDMDTQVNPQKNGALWKLDISSGIATLVMDQCGLLRGLAALPAPDTRLVATDYLSHVVYLFNIQTKSLTTLAGEKNQSGYQDGTGAVARFTNPYDVVITAAGEIIVADAGNHRLRKITVDGEVTTLAGEGTANTLDGPLFTAQFNNPQGLAIDEAQNIYVSELGGNMIRQITPAGDVTTIAGDGFQGFLDHLDPLVAQFAGLEGLDVTPNGTFLYIADGNRGMDTPFHRIRRMTLH